MSIGLPVYNGERVLEETMESLLGQTYEDFELVVSDNASTDGTASICHRYEAKDPRIRYFRQERNIGAAPNHNFVVLQSRGELFKWSSADDLCARTFLERCVGALDEHPEAVLAHSWTALIDEAGEVIEAAEYPSDTEVQRAPERFRSMLEGDHGSDDYAGVMRLAVLKQTPLHGSHHFADRTLFTELALRGPFVHVPQWLHFRRIHPDAAYQLHLTVRDRCANLDPRRADRVRHPSVRLYAEFAWGFVASIRRVPMSTTDRRACYRHLGRYLVDRALPSVDRVLRGGTLPRDELSTAPIPADISVDDVVAGRGERSR